jgi:diacylglycerol kinase family enzyme
MLASVKRALLIVNPYSTNVTGRRITEVARALGEHAQLQTEFTQRPGHATELAAEGAAAGVDAIVIFSGDGTYNEALNGAEGPTAFGFVPGGGTSVFPRGLGIPRDPLRATEQLVEAFEQRRTRRISVGRVNGRRFLFNAGLLFDAELVRRIEAQRSHAGRPGDVAFAATLLKFIAEQRGRFDPVLEIDGAGRVAFVLVANTDPYTFLGPVPVHVAPEATLEGGLDVIAPTKVRARSMPQLLRYVVTGRGRPESVLALRDVDRLSVRCDRPLPLQADGEDLGDVTEAVFEAERDALTVLY